MLSSLNIGRFQDRRSIVVRFAVGKEECRIEETKEVIWSPTRGWRPEQIISAIGRAEEVEGD